MKRLYKLTLAIWTVLRFTLNASWILLKNKDPWVQRQKVRKVISKYTKIILDHLDMHIHVKGKVPEDSCLVVGNHMSYLDIFIVSSVYPTCFVTSVEMRETPLLGHICKLGACVFVERRNKENIQKEISEITQALEKNMMVTIFPEATSTNGDEVIRFRRPLFNAALYAKKPVQPFCIQYKKIDGEPITTANRDSICWYDDMSFGGHFLSFLRARRVDIDLEFLDPIEFDPSLSVEAVVDKSYHQVGQSYVGFQRVPPENTAEVLV